MGAGVTTGRVAAGHGWLSCPATDAVMGAQRARRPYVLRRTELVAPRPWLRLVS